jgi:hypothetical protein
MTLATLPTNARTETENLMLSLVQEMMTVSPARRHDTGVELGQAGLLFHRWCSSRARCAGTQRRACQGYAVRFAASAENRFADGGKEGAVSNAGVYIVMTEL